MERASQAHHLKRVPLLLPQEMVQWIDRKTKGVENRTTFIRRLIAMAMEGDTREEAAPCELKTHNPEPRK